MNIASGRQAIVPTLLGTRDTGTFLTKAFLVLAGSAVIALAAHIQVPFWPVPATLQTLAIFVIAAAYGRNLAVLTVLAYLAEGAVGLPVFAKGGGLAYFAGPTAGYLAGFVIAAAITGAAADRGWAGNPFKLFGANLAGEMVILLLGAGWIAIAFGMEKAFAWGVGPFILTDLIKIALASALIPALSMIIRRFLNRS
ncbi:MAG: biotin transporter BioY [Rhizobiaceae bacterium]